MSMMSSFSKPTRPFQVPFESWLPQFFTGASFRNTVKFKVSCKKDYTMNGASDFAELPLVIARLPQLDL